MAQAKRIKKKPVKKPKSQSRLLNLPWGLLLVIAITGYIVISLIAGANSENSQWGQGLKSFWESRKPAPISEEQAIESLINEKSTPKEFEFYTILPNIEQIMPDDLPEAQSSQSRSDLDYYLQAASFRSYADAEKLRAQLALKGFVSQTQKRSTEDNGDFYRVRLGPYADKRQAKNQKNQLQKLGVKPFMFTVKKD